MEPALLTCIIDAEEERDTAVVDTPNVFVQTHLEIEKDMAFIKIQGVLVSDILVDAAPDVHKACVSKGKKGVAQLLVVQCQNALCGTMAASLLCCCKFAKSLTDINVVINPHNPCVANKMIDGEQMTIYWHVMT
jgi:hypothetical protein